MSGEGLTWSTVERPERERLGVLPGLKWLAVLVTTTLMLQSAAAQRTGELPADLQEAGINEHLGGTVPGDIVLRNDWGEDVRLEEYFDGKRPVILTLTYNECPMLCNLLLNGLATVMAQMEWTPGDEYEVVTVSFVPGETPELAKQAKERYLRRLDRGSASEGWHFLTGSQASIDRLTEAVGFNYKWVERQQDYAHPTALIFLSGTATISRYIYGIEYSPRDIRTALVEASEGKIGSTIDQVILYCFQFDPTANSYVPHAMNLMKLGGLLTVLVLGSILFIYWRRESHRVDEAGSAS